MLCKDGMQWGHQDWTGGVGGVPPGSNSNGSPPISHQDYCGGVGVPPESSSSGSPPVTPHSPEDNAPHNIQVNGTSQTEEEVNQSVVQQQQIQQQQQLQQQQLQQVLTQQQQTTLQPQQVQQEVLQSHTLQQQLQNQQLVQNEQQQQIVQSQQQPAPHQDTQQQQVIQSQQVLPTQQQVLSTQQQGLPTQQQLVQAVQAQQAVVQAQQLAVQQLVVQQPEERQCFPLQSDMSQYYARSHMLSPGSFMSYLKQPGVMLTTLNGVDSPNEFPGQHLPDLISQHQQHFNGNGKMPLTKSELRLFKCLTCGKDFKQKSTLLQHERIHTDSRPYGCSECGKRFRQQSHLTQHLRIHANEKPFSCGYCARTFRQRAILNQHLRIHSDVSPHLVYKNGQLWPQDVPFPSEKEQGFENEDMQCFPSDTQFPAFYKDSKGMAHGVFNQGKLPDVIQHGRSAGMPLYVRCPICQKEFKQKSTLLQHGCIHIESRPYPCNECGKRFRQQSHLTQHLRIHTNEKPYNCLYCGRNFRQRTILNQHVRIHTGEKPYKCNQCGKDFRQKAILDQHTRTHQGDRPFCCPMPNCRRRFATDQEVKRHIENHMNPHASKRRVELKRPASPASVKPELYFPQCYATAQMFNHQAYTTQLPEFKPAPLTPAPTPTPTLVQ